MQASTMEMVETPDAYARIFQDQLDFIRDLFGL